MVLGIMMQKTERPFSVSVLVFIKNQAGDFLMLKRKKEPNLGCWTPIGGKVETAYGESPHHCAVREVGEEAEFGIETADLHLFGMISEKSYEGKRHWLMFLFECNKPISHLPKDMDEGEFAFFSREAIDKMNDTELAKTDRDCLWAMYDKHHKGFVAMAADCDPTRSLEFVIEESF